ncbi:proline-rich receptor-like protein kinase PERK2 [Sinocyclocheilus grahami]|uniref:proline-rich receptor-like protein kinase PERK2 n=1 Tax=Sinocyclocheilus grahami TaxID=75366 RepID=UPI0007AC6F14|nr:PREDICTED: proline-rich receptor-like protein kinase PERK2 [Sinocyclocheilus grahami]
MNPAAKIIGLRQGHPLRVVNGQDLPWDSKPPATPSLEDPRSSSPAFETWSPLWSVDPLVSPWLKAPSSPLWPISPPTTPGFFAPPWSFVDLPSPQNYTPPASPHPSSSVGLLSPSCSALVLGRSVSTAAFWNHIFASVARAVGSTMAL